MDIKNEMLKRLRQDCETLLITKIPRALENISDERGVNTYRNLTKALADNIKLIEEYDYQLMYSEYTDVTDENKPVKQIAVWEQNGDCDIRNHKVWNVEDAINSTGVKADVINDGIDTIDDEPCDLYTQIVELIKDTIKEVCGTESKYNNTDEIDDDVSIELISDKKIFNTRETLYVNNISYTVANVINKQNKYEYSLLRTDEWNKHLRYE